MVFIELFSDLSQVNIDDVVHDPFPNASVYLVDFTDHWYGDILIYLQTQFFHANMSKDDCHCIRHQAKHYLVLDDKLYIVVSIPFFSVVLPMKKWNMFSMISMLGHVVVISWAWILPRKFCVWGTIGILSLNILLL